MLILCLGCIRAAVPIETPLDQSDYFLVMLVDARHLDYTNNSSLLRTIAKHPSDGSKNGDVGHAWIYLQGLLDGQPVFLEGGHSGERGVIQAKYFNGIVDYFEAGDANPIRYLWECQQDGFFQWGNGGHCPTYAAKINLIPEQFIHILNFVENYPFSEYYLTGNQCSSFVAQVAAWANLSLEDKITLEIDSSLSIEGDPLRLWSNPKYAEITLSSPDILESSLIKAVEEGRAAYALDWYLQTHRVSLKQRLSKTIEDLRRFPERFYRYRLISKIQSGSQEPEF